MADPIRCSDGCGRTVAGQSDAEAKAWTFLEISKRWRCPTCARELALANAACATAPAAEGGAP
ncbi:hypothetical protein [Variovorax sp.]|jgi:hypothetical protein|uniref:hypothetical protein n=1 Tax=Variovorax sp. TaxID=1871043 RepID=UPI0037DA24E8